MATSSSNAVMNAARMLALPAIGVLRVRPQPARERAAPSQQQTGNVAMVVAGICQQGQRVDLPAVEALDQHEPEIEGDADGERRVEVGCRVAVAVTFTHRVCSR